MNSLILRLYFAQLSLIGVACSAPETQTGLNMDMQFFENNRPRLEELALLFLSDRMDEPMLNHVSLKDIGPKSIELPKSKLDLYRELMNELGVSLVAKGDFSGNNLESTVYLVTNQRNLNEHFIQEGYLFGVNVKMGNGDSVQGFRLQRLESNWFYFVRKEEHELY